MSCTTRPRSVTPLTQGSRPPCLGEPHGPQERIQQQTMEQLADVVPMVQILYIPVPQMLEQLPDVLRFFASLLPVPSRLSKCPRSCSMTSLSARLCASRSWRNSWWKCRRLYPTLPCSGLWSSSLTFQFLVVEGDTLVFKVFFPDRVQQRRSCLWSALLSGLRSRSLLFLFLVEAFKIFAQDRFRPLLRMFQLAIQKAWMSLVKGVFALFSVGKKCGRPRPGECESAFALELMDAGGL